MICKNDLEHNTWYRGHCRNAEYAKWDAVYKRFVHWRTKFGEWFTEEILHPEDDQVWDVFEPYEKVDKPEHIKEIEL